MGKKKQKKNEAVTNSETAVEVETTKNSPVLFVVVRDGVRVSDVTYESENDPVAVSEKEFWTSVANNHSLKEPVEIVRYDEKKHKVW